MFEKTVQSFDFELKSKNLKSILKTEENDENKSSPVFGSGGGQHQ